MKGSQPLTTEGSISANVMQGLGLTQTSSHDLYNERNEEGTLVLEL